MLDLTLAKKKPRESQQLKKRQRERRCTILHGSQKGPERQKCVGKKRKTEVKGHGQSQKGDKIAENSGEGRGRKVCASI